MKSFPWLNPLCIVFCLKSKFLVDYWSNYLESGSIPDYDCQHCLKSGSVPDYDPNNAFKSGFVPDYWSIWFSILKSNGLWFPALSIYPLLPDSQWFDPITGYLQ